jgi:indolepyruvate ferredoxin oxidoreductase beta subunit
MAERARIFLTGVGGQGTLTATALLARVAVDQRICVVAGEIHGMAQRGGIVESVILLGGWRSPRIDPGEADLLLGFDLLETRRALPYLRPGGSVVSAQDILPPPGVLAGRESVPGREELRAAVQAAAARAWYVPVRRIGLELGAPQIGNAALLGAACATGLLPFGFAALEEGLRRHLPADRAEANITAARLGREAILSCRECPGRNTF